MPTTLRAYTFFYDSPDRHSFVSEPWKLYDGDGLPPLPPIKRPDFQYVFGQDQFTRRIYCNDVSYRALSDTVQARHEKSFSAPVQSQVRLHELIEQFAFYLLDKSILNSESD